MATATFIVKEPKSTKPSPIFLIFRFNNKRLKYSTGEKIEPKYWNTAKGRVSETRKFPQFPEFNSRLQHIEDTAFNVFRKLQNDKVTLTNDVLKENLNLALERTQNTKASDLLTFSKQLIEEAKKGEYRKLGGELFSKGTITDFNGTMKALERFKASKKFSLDFENINMRFYDQFVAFVQSEGKAKSTVGKLIKNVKNFMRVAEDRGLHSNGIYRTRSFKKVEEVNLEISLDTSDLSKLQELDLSSKPSLERVRDLFLVGCNTGQRFSDWNRITLDNIDKNEILKFKSQKTGKECEVPVYPVVKEILQKYNGKLPLLTNQKMNKYLKDLGKLAGFKEKHLRTETKGEEKVTFSFERWERITTHTARRSFATIMFFEYKVPAEIIMKVTGHKKLSTFMRYIRAKEGQLANTVREMVPNMMKQENELKAV